MLKLSARRPALEGDVLSLHVATFAQSLAERFTYCLVFGKLGRYNRKQAYPWDFRCRLRMGGEWRDVAAESDAAHKSPDHLIAEGKFYHASMGRQRNRCWPIRSVDGNDDLTMGARSNLGYDGLMLPVTIVVWIADARLLRLRSSDSAIDHDEHRAGLARHHRHRARA